MTQEDQNKQELKSQAKKINTLLQMQKGMLGRQQRLVNFKQPCLMLLRNNKKAEWYENATIGKFEYTHSNGEDMYITLNRHFLQTLDYAGKEIQIYICHEDYPFPLPHEPLITAELKKISDEKILNDYRKWLAEELKAKGDMWWKILLGIAIIGGVYVLYRMLTPATPVTPVETEVINNTVDTLRNATVFN